MFLQASGSVGIRRKRDIYLIPSIGLGQTLQNGPALGERHLPIGDVQVKAQCSFGSTLANLCIADVSQRGLYLTVSQVVLDSLYDHSARILKCGIGPTQIVCRDQYLPTIYHHRIVT